MLIGHDLKTQLAEFADLDDEQEWWNNDEVQRHYAMMSERHKKHVDDLLAAGGKNVGAIFRRGRNHQQRAEVRFDGLAGCLRTPRGGSAKQIIMFVDGGRLRMRWMSAREYARLQGAEDFLLDGDKMQLLFGFGDAVCVPVIRWIDAQVLTPIFNEAAALIQGESLSSSPRKEGRKPRRMRPEEPSHPQQPLDRPVHRQRLRSPPAAAGSTRSSRPPRPAAPDSAPPTRVSACRCGSPAPRPSAPRLRRLLQMHRAELPVRRQQPQFRQAQQPLGRLRRRPVAVAQLLAEVLQPVQACAPAPAGDTPRSAAAARPRNRAGSTPSTADRPSPPAASARAWSFSSRTAFSSSWQYSS